MLFFISSSHNPAFNLATEEFLLKNYEDDFFFLYINIPSLIVGKHQNTLAEINIEKAEQEKIPVFRRLSGGGTVFHDEGNLNYCFIKKGEKGKLVDFQKYSSPIIDTLQKLKVNAKFEGKSDLTIDGKKFSGNASHVFKNKVMQHGTMLFSSDLSRLNQLLKVNPLKFKDRGVRSIRSRVTNISDYLSLQISMDKFAALIIQEFKLNFPEAIEFELSDLDEAKIKLLMTKKYNNWKWNYGYSPNYKFEKLCNFPEGTILEISMIVEKGIIKKVTLEGNCLNFANLSDFERILSGTIHYKSAILNLLEDINLNLYFKNINTSQLIKAFF
ncbi:lipoate--protein ligase [Ancylomarina longa]|uniref:lipoate--protein ligase n=1 Tax=Ancylomarina longa TaxID=2487017 RepID=A0A434AWQ0_9BACT|nr:lipoate--protein ligase [Ancylomarina longa]RUT78827.1 lipoate--protein ligase [Ancylomarina longa]